MAAMTLYLPTATEASVMSVRTAETGRDWEDGSALSQQMAVWSQVSRGLSADARSFIRAPDALVLGPPRSFACLVRSGWLPDDAPTGGAFRLD